MAAEVEAVVGDTLRDIAEVAARLAVVEDYLESLSHPRLVGDLDTSVPLQGRMSAGYSATIHVLYDKILVKRAPERDTPILGGKLVAPEIAKERPLEGEVLAVGNGRITPSGLVPLRILAGDSVIFGRYSGTEVDLGGETFLVLREDEVLAIVRTSAEPLPEPADQVLEPVSEPVSEPVAAAESTTELPPG